MPIVSRRKIKLHGRDFLLKIGYSTDHRQRDFYMPFPDWVADTLHKKEVRGKTQQEVEQKFWEDIKEYERITAQKKKVIFYKFLSRVQPYGMPLRGFFSGMSADTGKGEMISYGIALDLWFLVGHTVSMQDGSVDYFDENMKKWGTRGEPHCRIMDWTEPRELFFMEAREVVAEQIRKMHDFFYDDRSKVPELIDMGMTGRKFLPDLSEDSE